MQKVTLAQFYTLPKASAEYKTVDLQCVKLDSIALLESILKLARKKDLVIVGFDPPWAIDPTQCGPYEWLEFHVDLSELRKNHTSQIDLLDISHHDKQALEAHAGIKMQSGGLVQAPSTSSLLEVMYATYLPEYVRTYESLRSMAIAAPETWPSVRSKFIKSGEALAAIREIAYLHKCQASESKDKFWESEKHDLKSENDLLLDQLHYVQEVLERYYLRNKDLEGAINEATQMVRQARLKVVENKPASQALGKRAAGRRR